MEIYDIVMIVVLAGAMIFGAIKGFAWQLASIASIVISYAVAFKYREPFSQSIEAEPPWNRFLAMLILYIGTSLVIWVVFRMVSGTIDRLKLREFDRQVGAMFGLAKGGLYCILITLFAVTLMGDTVRTKIVQSKSGNYIANVLQRSEAVVPAEIQDVVQPYLERFDRRFQQPLDSDGSSQTPWISAGTTFESDSASAGSTSSHPATGLAATPGFGGLSQNVGGPNTGGSGAYQPPPSWQGQSPSWQGQSAAGRGGAVPDPNSGRWLAPQQAQQRSWNQLQR